ncbi:phage holin family protein [Klugiella xanthotipulae]|uniref:Putative membrane protein n=1 Tax=Klugiella xanthotipulae TaxID=244735 RepID=A0A543I6L6_9MICO|nr:phage holin family protein [Klugiella xanthotipulae]TQM66256.1 putative membrane protein [Klugiella xanthotipulae]
MAFVIRVLISAVSLWFTTLIVGGNGNTGVWVDPLSDTAVGVTFTFLVVAFIFGLVNATLGTVIRIVSIPLYIITLGLFAFIVNGLMLLLTAWFSDLIGFGLRVDGFWWGVLGAIVLSLFTWAINLVVKPSQDSKRDRD